MGFGRKDIKNLERTWCFVGNGNGLAMRRNDAQTLGTSARQKKVGLTLDTNSPEQKEEKPKEEHGVRNEDAATIWIG